MRKPEVEPPTSAAGSACPDAKFATSHPTITSYLTDTQYDDGSPRQPGSLSVRIEEGEVRLALNDVDNGRSMYTAASSLSEALKLMEGHLKATGGTWRAWKGKGKGKRG